MTEQRTFQGVSITFDEHWARIVTDAALFAYLERRGKKDASLLAVYLKSEYETIYGKPLEISADSLAIEILIHAYIDKLAKALHGARLPEALLDALGPLLSRIEASTAMIDCGERCVDNNHFVFDGLEPFAPLIIALLDK